MSPCFAYHIAATHNTRYHDLVVGQMVGQPAEVVGQMVGQ